MFTSTNNLETQLPCPQLELPLKKLLRDYCRSEMSKKLEIAAILAFKTWLSKQYNRPSSSSPIVYFENLLLSTAVRAQLTKKVVPNVADSWTRNYFFATALSVLFEKEQSYDLDLWNGFVKTIHPKLSNAFLQLKKIGESDVLELLALHTINKTWSLVDDCIWAVRPNSSSAPTELLNDYNEREFSKPVNDRILKRIRVIMKKRGTQGVEVWGDNDVIVVGSTNASKDDADIFCIISCKLSLRERVYQSVFWSTHSRLEGVGRHTFLTLDKGNEGRSEIGVSGTSTLKARDVIESTFDRVYVFRKANEVSRSYVIKDFHYLATDLRRWREDYFGI